MRQTIAANKTFRPLAVLIAAALTLGSCDLMHDDLAPCATDPAVTTVVNFVYDYNMSGEDLFDRHVGSVYLYVFDENDVFVGRYEKNKRDLDPVNPDFSMTFDGQTSAIRRGRTYKFVAVANGAEDGYDGDDETPGFKLVNAMVPGVSTINDYILKLNRDDKMFADFGVVDYTQDYSGPDAMIDSVWTTKPDEVQVHDIPDPRAGFDSADQLPDHVEEVRIPMMRITNSIEVALTSPAFTADTRPSDYDILIYFPDGNGTIDFVGETLTEISQPLYYRALRKRVDTYQTKTGTRAGEEDGEEDVQYAIYATFGVSRLKYGDGSSLQVRDPQTHEVLAEITDFSAYLNDRGNTEYDDPQEYLDREYNFRLDLGLTGGGSGGGGHLWWSQVGIGVHDWAVRDWYVSL